MATLRAMARLSKRGRSRDPLRAFARDLAPGGPPAIRQFLVRRFRFQHDPRNVELLKSPGVLLAELENKGYASGDCDDAAILGASLALAAGFPVRWVVLGFHPRGPFGHVYAEAFDAGQWTDFDVTRPAQFPAGLVAHRRRVIPLR